MGTFVSSNNAVRTSIRISNMDGLLYMENENMEILEWKNVKSVNDGQD